MKETIIGYVNDLVADFLYYNRKEDENLPVGAIEKAINNSEISIDEIVKAFSDELKKTIAQP